MGTGEDESILWSWNRQRELSPTRNQISQHSCSRCRWPKYLIISLQIKGVKGQIFSNAFLPQKIFTAGKTDKETWTKLWDQISRYFQYFDSLSQRSKTLKQMQILEYEILQPQIFWLEMFVKSEILCFSDRIRSVFNPCMFVFRGGESLGDISPQKEFHPNKISSEYFAIFC